MSPGDAVSEALDALAAERTAYLSLSETIALLGGTRAAAAALGVSQRSVQRWLAGGTPGKKAQKAIAREQRRLAAETLREEMKRGYAIDAEDFSTVYEPSRERSKAIDIEEPDEARVDAMLDAWLAGDKEALSRAFDGEFYGAWGQGRMDGFQTAGFGGLSLSTRG